MPVGETRARVTHPSTVFRGIPWSTWLLRRVFFIDDGNFLCLPTLHTYIYTYLPDLELHLMSTRCIRVAAFPPNPEPEEDENVCAWEVSM